MTKLGADFLTPEAILNNLRNFDQIRKSVTAVTGLELVRQDLEDELKLAANLKTPVRKRLKRIKGEGKAHAFYKLTSNPGTSVTNAKFLGTDPTGMSFAKGGLPTAVDAQYEYLSRPYANLGDLVIIPWQDIAQDESFIDIKAQQRRVKTVNVALGEEYFILNGDSAATGGLAFDGIITQILNDGFNVLDLSGGGGAALSYGVIRQQCFNILKAGGQTRALIMSYVMKERMTAMLGQLYAIRQVGPGGSTTYGGGQNFETWDFGTGSVDLIADQYMVPDVNGLERIVFLDDESTDDAPQQSGNVVQMVDVDPLNYRDLQSITTSERGIIYETSMLMISITQYQGLILGFNPALTPVLD